VCCDVPVNSKDSPEGMAYQQAIDQFKTAHCAVPCPAIVCLPHATCMGSAGAAGQCVPTP
jgi:hypothetical protein